jgi:hypothetical protein
MKNLVRVVVLALALAGFGAITLTPSASEAARLDTCSCFCSDYAYGSEGYWNCMHFCRDECRYHVCPLCKK